MNKIIMIGNLASDVETRTTQSGDTAGSFRLAVQRRFVNQQGVREADFFNVVVWRKIAENCAKYLAKGRKCAVVGSLQTRSYEKDGQKHYVTEIVADEVEFIGGSKDQAQSAPESAESGGFTPVEDDELPF